MATKYYKKHKKRLRKEARETYQNLCEEEKTKDEKKPERDTKMLLIKKNKKGITIIRNVGKSYLSKKEVTI